MSEISFCLFADKLLLQFIGKHKKVAIAYSGGVDSSLVALAAYKACGENAIAVSAFSESSTAEEIQTAKEIADWIGIPYFELRGREMDEALFVANNMERCYHCKKIRLGDIAAFAAEKQIHTIMDGSNADDADDFRPGTRAVKEFGVISPLAVLGICKTQVREIAKAFGLPNWDLPSNPCLCTRIEYGIPIQVDLLKKIADAEKILKSNGFSPVRVRCHSNGDLARIELEPSQIAKFCEESVRKSIAEQFKKLGFHYITLDLHGFQSGSMNRNNNK